MTQDGNFSELTAGLIQTSLYGRKPTIRGAQQGGPGVPAYRGWINWVNADSEIGGVGVRAMLIVFGQQKLERN